MLERAAARPFRILSLSGGGVRGIFQSTFLRQLEKDLAEPLNRTFDLIAGTSTGGILALAVASGMSADQVVNLYRTHASEIFRSRVGGGFRRGARYESRVLARELRRWFETRRLEDLEVEVVIAASSLETYGGKILTRRTDPQMALADAALATAAAPTYFTPVTPVGAARSYVDGGLWANNPALLAILYAHNHLREPFDRIRTLAIGTGVQPSGEAVDDVARLRPFSTEALNLLFELTMGSQAWFSEEFGRDLMTPERFLVINPSLKRKIALDDVRSALGLLPALAESCYEESREGIVHLLRDDVPSIPVLPPALEPSLARSLEEGGITAFYPSREHYSKYRVGGSIEAYVATARRTLLMVSINLSTGVLISNLFPRFEEMICKREEPVDVTISLIDPRVEHLMKTLAPVLDTTEEELKGRIANALARLARFRDAELAASGRSHFHLRVHRALPAASAIMIDDGHPTGRIQLETKPYKVAMESSYAIEIGFGSQLYSTLADSYRRLVSEGDEVGKWPPS